MKYLTFLKRINLLVLFLLSVSLVSSCKKTTETENISYLVSGKVYDTDGSLFKPTRIDILYLDFPKTNVFNGGPYVLGSNLSLAGDGSFSGAFTAPMLSCDLHSFDFVIIKNDTVKHQIIQRAVLDSSSQITCIETSSSQKKINFSIMTKLP